MLVDTSMRLLGGILDALAGEGMPDGCVLVEFGEVDRTFTRGSDARLPEESG